MSSTAAVDRGALMLPELPTVRPAVEHRLAQQKDSLSLSLVRSSQL